ncbi:2-isopropylmalate synthase [Zoogloea dura]|uniref:2-isopropylmalate synthase n=1 Tax=Zoogloea dura TaxID=2728840 RepID=A0A848G183_9RHOO|nr:2-isopropylmalate synthase [Zoogloea dura]NML24830.1 2-isopropylmalate synthase [Zoogloea dura]
MLKNPNTKYSAFPPVALADRQWPARTITHPPIWMSTDLRDGNQALFEPMDAARKLRMFRKLVAIGFKEIEVAFPSASQTDFDFVRHLIEQGEIPDDVTIEVLSQAREHLIRRTMESLRGARRAIVHIYNATSPVFRETVFGMSKDEVKALAVSSVRLVKELAASQPETEWVLQYSPETFTATELDFAKEVCDAVVAEWDPRPGEKVIINLPSTVEVAMPNVYADQIEWMHRNLARRDQIVLSVHPHNDRGTGVAAAEMAMLAGADRVEGCLFGNGERTGNVDVVTLALNMYTQGIHPGLDFSDINDVARVAEECTQLPIHPRHPYVGDLVFTAFSGSHQDAIKKGFEVQQADALWAVPYMPVDPADLGRTYDSVIRVNSQSGKGGVAHLLHTVYGLVMPRRMQVEFSTAVQCLTDESGQEVDAHQLWNLFSREYLEAATPVRYMGHHLYEAGERQGIRLEVEVNGRCMEIRGEGNGPVEAAVAALRMPIRVQSFEERSMGEGADAAAMAMIEVAMEGVAGSTFGAGMDRSTVTASIRAIVSAANRIRVREGSGAVSVETLFADCAA